MEKYLYTDTKEEHSEKVAGWFARCKKARIPFILVSVKPNQNAAVRWNCESLSKQAIASLLEHSDEVAEGIQVIFDRVAGPDSVLIQSAISCSMYGLSPEGAKAAAAGLYKLIEDLNTDLNLR